MLNWFEVNTQMNGNKHKNENKYQAVNSVYGVVLDCQ